MSWRWTRRVARRPTPGAAAAPRRVRRGFCPRCGKPRILRLKLCRTCKELLGKTRAQTAREREFDQAVKNMVREKFGQQ